MRRRATTERPVLFFSRGRATAPFLPEIQRTMNVLVILLLALVPWLPFFQTPTRAVPRATFPALIFLRNERAQRRRQRRRIVQTLARSLALATLATLWLDPFPTVDATAVNAVDPEIRAILLVDGSDSGPLESRPGALETAEILELALAAQFGDGVVTRQRSVDFAHDPAGTLERCDAVVLADLSGPIEGEADALARFLARGGRALICSGPRVRPESWNRTLRRWQIDATVVDARLEDAPSVPSGALERAFLQAFPDASGAGLDALPVVRTISCVGPDARPFLRDRRTGASYGSLLKNGARWLGVSPDRSFGALVTHPAFPALVERSLLFDAKGIGTDVRSVALRARLRIVLWLVATLAALAELVLTLASVEKKRKGLIMSAAAQYAEITTSYQRKGNFDVQQRGTEKDRS